ncbi:MATE family efflux transporter [Reinekea marinisedimentorum]|uniref:MATE family multidrug resistance protein n=1 Tax=Reinekea marinisedimentorum TaxID=230495 RepID=A0A4R3IB65_9GAMM|nr:MATE family efflux transporter [Reinekea marinisedimentorum]TCS43840.1 MATE family multidrug resistance protein [Reinekea marinisedimentorum]
MAWVTLYIDVAFVNFFIYACQSFAMTLSENTPSLSASLLKTWHLAWPVILANLSLPLLGLADAAILGHLESSLYLAGVTVGTSVMAYVFWGFNFLGMGLSGFTSQALGAEKHLQVIHQLMRYAIVAAVLIFVLLVFHRFYINAGLHVISPEADVFDQAELYLKVRMIGVPAIVFNSMLLGFFIGLQNTRISLYTLSVTQILNIGFNFLFVYGLGYKTAGIAIGTVISEYLGLILILYHLRRTLRELNTEVTEPMPFVFQLKDFLPIFHVSSHLFVRTFVLLSAFIWFNRIAANFGELTLATNGVLLTFFTLIAHFLDGTAAAAEAQTGHAYGQKNQQQLTQVWRASALLNGGFMLLLALLFVIFGLQIFDLLTNQQDLIAKAREVMPWVALLPVTGGIAFWLDGVFIGARRSKDLRNSVLAAFLTFCLSSLYFADNNVDLWICFNAFFAVRSIWLLNVFFRKML